MVTKNFNFTLIDPLPAETDYKLFKRWRIHLENNAGAQQVRAYSQETQKILLIAAIGSDASEILRVDYSIDANTSGNTVDKMLN